jgi:hypothetical protein
MDMLSLDEFLDRIAAKCVEEGLRYDFDVSYKPEYQIIGERAYYECRLSIEIFDVDENNNAITYCGEFIIPDGGLQSTILRIRNWLKDVLGWTVDVEGDG